MKLLIVDDNEDVIHSLKGVFEEHETLSAENIKNARKILDVESESIDVAIIDIMLGEDDGIELLNYIKSKHPSIECIMISGYSSVEKAVLSIKFGAFDFVEKPISYQKIKVVLNNALEHKRYANLLKKELDKYRLVGTSAAVKQMNEMIEKAAQLDFPVLITGESGVGKEHIANLIHLKSKRGRNEMIKLNCAAIPESLFESELFGHEKGSFTGAAGMKKGKIELSNSSSLFMDEIGEMPLNQQAKLLRVLEDRTVTRVGGESVVKVDFRLIAATNKVLKEKAQSGEFREDLYYRIGVLLIDIPPLRERKDDVIMLAEHFFKIACAENNCLNKTIGSSALEYLSGLPLKGNIRELKNMMQRVFAFSESGEIDADEVKKILNFNVQAASGTDEIFQKTMPYSDAKRILEQKYIVAQLRIHENNISKTAIALGMLPNNLVRKMKELEISVS